MRREKELNAKSELADAARSVIENDSKIEELELQLQKCLIEKNDLEVKMKEALQDSGETVCHLSQVSVSSGSKWSF